MGHFCTANCQFASHRHKLLVCATTSIVCPVFKINLSKCPNNFKVHYKIKPNNQKQVHLQQAVEYVPLRLYDETDAADMRLALPHL